MIIAIDWVEEGELIEMVRKVPLKEWQIGFVRKHLNDDQDYAAWKMIDALEAMGRHA
jgi:hypothetical protein